MKPLLDISDLWAGYGGRLVLNGITTSIESGKIIALLGRNGAGKSTLLRTIAGASRPVSGSIRFGGLQLDGLPLRKRIQMGISLVEQNRACFPDLTVAENLKVAMSCLDLRKAQFAERRERVLCLLPALRPFLSERVAHLSGGQQQLLVFGMALCLEPKLLLLDEPSVGLGEAVLSMLLTAVRKFVSDGGAVLVVEQKLSVASALADTALYLDDGKIAMTCTVDELLNDPGFLTRYLGIPSGGRP